MSSTDLIHRKSKMMQTFATDEEFQAFIEGLVTPRVSTQRQVKAAIEFVDEPERPLNYSARPAAERIRARTEYDSAGCLIWTGNQGSNGYGQIRVDGTVWSIHRLVWVMHFGRVPGGLVVMHLCDKTLCVEIDHLVLGTQAANVFDRDQKGRGVTP